MAAAVAVAVAAAGGGGGRAGGAGGMFGGQLTIVSLIDAGTVVNKGDVVVQFDREEMLTRLDDFKARVSQNEISISTIKAQLDVLEKTHAQTLKEAVGDVDKGGLTSRPHPCVSVIDSEKLKLNFDEATATHKRLLTEVPMMEQSLQSQWKLALLSRDEGLAELKRTEANADRMVPARASLRPGGHDDHDAPGRGDTAQIKAGDQVGSGAPIMRIVDLSSMIVNAVVNQVDAEQIRIGAKAQVRFDAYPELQLPAEVYSIAAIADGRAVARRLCQRGSHRAPAAAAGQAGDPRSLRQRGRGFGDRAADGCGAAGGDLQRRAGRKALFVFLQRPRRLAAARCGTRANELRVGCDSLRPAGGRCGRGRAPHGGSGSEESEKRRGGMNVQGR